VGAFISINKKGINPGGDIRPEVTPLMLFDRKLMGKLFFLNFLQYDCITL